MADAQGKEGRRRPLSIDLNLPTLLLLLLLLVFPVNSAVLILAASSLPQSKLTHPICKSLTAGKSLCNQPAAGVFFFLPSIRADESTILGLKEVRLVALVLFFFPLNFCIRHRIVCSPFLTSSCPSYSPSMFGAPAGLQLHPFYTGLSPLSISSRYIFFIRQDLFFLCPYQEKYI